MRIASLAPSCTEILYELGGESDIVATTIYCDYPEPAKQLPKIGSWINIDRNKLRELQPDLVLTSSIVQGKLTQDLKQEGFRVVNINPTRLYEVVESYNQIGQLVGREREGARLAGVWYKRIMSYHLRHTRQPIPRVYCEEWSDPPMVSGNWVPDLVQLAGGQPGIVDAGSLSRLFDFSQLQAFDPQIMLMHICGMGDRVEAEGVKKRPGWESLQAVQNNQVHVLDDSLLNRPTSRLLVGLEKIIQIIEGFHAGQAAA